MNKKLMAVAIAGGLAVPALAFAQASTVQIYGQLQVEYMIAQDGGGSGSTTNPSRPTRDAVLNTTSYWGIKGDESLGGGLTAWWQMEQNLPVNGTTNNGATAGNPNNTTVVMGGNVNGNVGGNATSGVSPGLTCDRNCALGIKGGYGNIFMGSWYTPKFNAALGAQLPGGATTPQGWAQIMGNAQATGNNITNATSFARRSLNSVNYESPDLSGFTINANFTGSNEKTAPCPVLAAAAGGCPASAVASPGLSPREWGVAGRYSNGPLYLSLGYERHNDYNPAAQANGTYQGGNDTGWELRGSYVFAGVFRLLGAYERLSYTATSGLVANTNIDHTSWFIAGDWNVAGPHNLRMMYERGQSTSGTFGGARSAVTGLCANAQVGNYVANCGQGNTGSNLWTLEYAYNFSKRTSLYLDYAKMNNDSNANTALNTVATPNLGANQTSYGVGLRHKF